MTISPSKLTFKLAFARAFLACFIWLLGTGTVLAEPDEDLPSVTLIYDLSNSMWAVLNETPKVTHAQTGILAGLSGLNKQINFGLLAFGHNEKSGCENVETIQPLTVLNDAKTKVALKPLRPRGNAPIGKALLEAANLASNRALPYTIILLSDGATNCPIDPCSTAKTLSGGHSGLMIDVIALGPPKSKTLNTLSCIATPSKGSMVYAATSKDIGLAIKASIKRASARLKAHLQNRQRPLVVADKNPKAKGDTPKNDWAGATEIIVDTPKEDVKDKAKDGAPDQAGYNKNIAKTHGGLALLSHLIDKGPPIKSGLIWRIYEEKPDKVTGKHKLISAYKVPRPVMSLPKGSYLINAAYGRAFLTRKISIKAGENKNEHFVLNAGGLKISSVLANGNPVLENTVIFDIFSDERDQYGKRIKVIGKVRPNLVVRLNAGIYHIVSTYGDANASSRADISVEAGKMTQATIDHKAAKATFKLVYQKGGEALADTQWSLLSPTGKIIKKSAGALPTHFLAAGDYTVLAERGDKKYSQHFSIEAGETRQIEVIIQ